MFKKTMKKILSGALAVTSVFACVGTFTACETSHPEVKMTISFHGEEYDLQYKMYRKTNRATTEHFIWLVEQGYYDGLCIHDYDETSLRMYAGKYQAQENGELEEIRPYYEFVQDAVRVQSFPHSVWADTDKTSPLYTVRGEFADGSYSPVSGAIKQSYGSLSMYYTQKDTNEKVCMEYENKEHEGMKIGNYKYNSATSMFFISMKETESTNSSYCTFATLTKDGKEEFSQLMDAIADYVLDVYGEDQKSDFTMEEIVTIDADDLLLRDYSAEATYNVPQEPIVIKSVKVTKY